MQELHGGLDFPVSSAGSEGGWDEVWVDGRLLVPPVAGGTA